MSAPFLRTLVFLDILRSLDNIDLKALWESSLRFYSLCKYIMWYGRFMILLFVRMIQRDLSENGNLIYNDSMVKKPTPADL